MENVTRKLDELGRIVLPRAMCEKLDWCEGEKICMHMERGGVFLTAETPHCVLCGGGEALAEVNGKKLCGACIKAIRQV